MFNNRRQPLNGCCLGVLLFTIQNDLDRIGMLSFKICSNFLIALKRSCSNYINPVGEAITALIGDIVLFFFQFIVFIDDSCDLTS